MKKSLVFVGLFLVLSLSVFVSAQEEILIKRDIMRAYGDLNEIAWNFVSDVERLCEADINRDIGCEEFFAEYIYAKDSSVLSYVQIERSTSEIENVDFLDFISTAEQDERIKFKESTFSSFDNNAKNNLYIRKLEQEYTTYQGKSYTCGDGTNIIVRDSGSLTSETLDINEEYEKYCGESNKAGNQFVWYSGNNFILITSYAQTPSEHLVLAYLEKFSSDLVFCDEGCELNDKCVDIGYRKSGEYCGLEGSFVFQLETDSQCDNSFECGSNVCVNNQCISGDLIQRILNWFRKVFSGE